MSRRRAAGTLAALTLLCTPLAHAQRAPLPLDTLHVSATSRAAADVASGTRAVEVIGAEEIRRSPARTVGELLQWAMGVDIAPRSPALVDVSIRGGSFEQVLVLVDGMRVSDAQTGHFDLNLAVPLDQVERLEIVRGPGSALHGADAMGGVVHVVTRRGTGSRARLEGGSFGAANLAGAHTFRGSGVTTDVAADLQRSDGHREGTDYRTGMARVAVHAPVGGRTLAADLGVAARDFGADGFYGPFPSYEKTRTGIASVAWRADAGAKPVLEPALSARWHGDEYILRRADPDFFRNEHTTLQLGGELVGRYAASPVLRLAGGAEAYLDRLRSQRLGDRTETRAALLAEAVAGRVGSLTATAGLRLDRHEAFGLFWSPSLAAAWWPVEGLRLRGSTGRAFRTPTWTERYYRDPANIGDPDLSSERAWASELGLDAYPLRRLRLSGSAFLRDASNLIDWARPESTPGDPWRTRNVRQATFRGLETEVALEEVFGVRVVGRGSWLSLEASESAGYLSKYALRPMAETLSLSLDRDFLTRLEVALRAQRARRRGDDTYTRLDARAAYRLSRARLYLDLQNATDEAYPDITGLPAPGRALLAGLEWGPPR